MHVPLVARRTQLQVKVRVRVRVTGGAGRGARVGGRRLEYLWDTSNLMLRLVLG